MTPIELAAVIAGYLLAIVRLFNAARFAWAWLPNWAQLALPAALVALPQLATALGGVHTHLDIIEAVIVALGAVFVAARGTPSIAKPPKENPA